MKRAVAGVAAASALLAAGYFGVRMTEPKPEPAIARATVNDMSATAKVGATKEETWRDVNRSSNLNSGTIAPVPVASAGVPTHPSKPTIHATSAQPVSTSTAPESPLSPVDPYRYSMTDPNAGPVKECETCQSLNQSAPASVPATTTALESATVVRSATPMSKSRATSAPDASNSASFTDLDTATADSWWASIRATYPVAAKHYAWIEHAGFRVADWKLNGSGMRPVDYFGSIGLDSPLGICRGIVELTPVGLLKSMKRGLVCVFGKFCVAATIDTPRCPQGVCSAHYDRPCVLLEADDVAVWVGGNPDDPKERERWGVK